MVWTYDVDLTDPKDEIRFMVGDTDEADPMAQDEEIQRMLVLYPPVASKPAYLAAAAVCDAIAGRFGRQIQRSVGPLSAANQQQYDHYKDLAAQFRMGYQTNGVGQDVQGVVKVAAPRLGGGGATTLGDV